ncbi:MAG: cytochrome c biogenesis protein CcsA [Xanthomonadales bacterium]|nr:cytochrome c biogenesis protein CcsA [Xanthomonadales bacterium]
MPLALTIALFFYLAAAALTAGRLRHGVDRIGHAPVLFLAGLGVLFHAAALAMAIHAAGGVRHSFGFALSVVGLGMAAVQMLAARRRHLDPLGVLVYPIAAGCVLVALLLPDGRPGTGPDTWQISLHALTSLLAYSTLSVASLAALLLAIQEHALRTRRPLPFLQSLPLTLTEGLLFRLLQAGFVLLSLSLVSGVLFIEDILGQHLAHKTFFSVASWLVFGGLLLSHHRYGLRGRRAAWLTLSGMALLLLAYFGTKAILSALGKA